MAQAVRTRGPVSGTAVTPRRRRRFFLADLYSTAVGKKYAMAVTGIMLIGFVIVHMLGNLKMYLGQDDLDHYAEFLRELLVPIVPHGTVLWILRLGLIAAVLVHIHAAASLTALNRTARSVKYQSARDYQVASFASRTMRWTGVIVALFVLWHLADLARTDDLAARIVLHRILPALMSIARRRGRIHPHGPYAAMEELLTTAWSVIRTYPSDRRPRKVAANLVRDCEYHAFVRPQRLRRAEEIPVEDMRIIADTPTDPEPADELDEVLDDALAAGVSERDIDLLRALASGTSSAELAEILGVSPRTVRNWRLRAIDAVRESLRHVAG